MPPHATELCILHPCAIGGIGKIETNELVGLAWLLPRPSRQARAAPGTPVLPCATTAGVHHPPGAGHALSTAHQRGAMLPKRGSISTHSPQTRKSRQAPSDSQINTPKPASEQGMTPSPTTNTEPTTPWIAPSRRGSGTGRDRSDPGEVNRPSAGGLRALCGGVDLALGRAAMMGEARVPAAEAAGQVVVEDSGADLEEELGSGR